MRRFAPLLLLICVVAALGVAGCGGDDEGGGDTTATTPTETAPADEGGGAASTVRVAADPGGDLAYVQDSLTADAGQIRFAFTNEASVPHDFKVEQDGNELGGTEVITSDSAEVTLDLEAGRYTFFCSVPGHRQAGMEGPLEVR